MLRKMCEKRWNDNSALSISNSEWVVMARIYKKKLTITNVSKLVDISRQAAHKLLKKMETKGLVDIAPSDNNKEKWVQLTLLGEDCYEKYMLIKAELEQKIADSIGAEQIASLKKTLTTDWDIAT